MTPHNRQSSPSLVQVVMWGILLMALVPVGCFLIGPVESIEQIREDARTAVRQHLAGESGHPLVFEVANNAWGQRGLLVFANLGSTDPAHVAVWYYEPKPVLSLRGPGTAYALAGHAVRLTPGMSALADAEEEVRRRSGLESVAEHEVAAVLLHSARNGISVYEARAQLFPGK